MFPNWISSKPHRHENSKEQIIIKLLKLIIIGKFEISYVMYQDLRNVAE